MYVYIYIYIYIRSHCCYSHNAQRETHCLCAAECSHQHDRVCHASAHLSLVAAGWYATFNAVAQSARQYKPY